MKILNKNLVDFAWELERGREITEEIEWDTRPLRGGGVGGAREEKQVRDWVFINGGTTGTWTDWKGGEELSTTWFAVAHHILCFRLSTFGIEVTIINETVLVKLARNQG